MLRKGVARHEEDEDGRVGPGDIARGTECTLPPPPEAGDLSCYGDAEDSTAYMPSPGECGNAFHTVIETTNEWQLVLVPWEALEQWPCPNRLDGGINPADIAKFEIALPPSTHYEIWIDNIAFYRPLAGG